MSFELPLLANGMDINQLGSEFDKLQSLDRDRGLLQPMIRQPEIMHFNDRTNADLSGIEETNLILQNNANASEELFQTDAGALQMVSEFSNRPLNDVERFMVEQQDFNLDPKLLNAVRAESRHGDSNMFAEQSQDFINEVRQSLETFREEKNLLLGPPEDRLHDLLEGSKSSNEAKVIAKIAEELAKAGKGEQDATTTASKILNEGAKVGLNRAEEEFLDAEKLRRATVPLNEPFMSEKLKAPLQAERLGKGKKVQSKTDKQLIEERKAKRNREFSFDNMRRFLKSEGARDEL
jgi:hypothetical protein